MMKCLALAALMLLPGCAGLAQFTPTMEADPSEIGGEGIFLMNELAKAYEPLDRDKCLGVLPSFQEQRKYPYSRHAGRDSLAHRFDCIAFRPAVASEVANHVRAGFNLSDLYCDTFFRRIAQRSNKRRFGRNAFNDVGTAVSTALALAAAGTTATGAAGAGFGLIDGSFRNYDDSFLVTADLQVLQPKVHAEQTTFKRATYANMPDNYFDANMAIIRYANFCSFIGMKALLNEAVVRSTNPNAAREALEAYAVSAATSAQAQEVAILEEQARLAEAKLAAQARIVAAAKSAEEATTDNAATESPTPGGAESDKSAAEDLSGDGGPG